MSWATCYSGTNNIHKELPPLMSDGRNYSTYETPSLVDRKIAENNNIKSNMEYRKFLTNNAEQLIKQNHISACNNTGTSFFNTEYDRRFDHYNKYLFKSCGDKTQPYGYEGSDLKNAYLSREELQSKLVAPLMSQQGYLLNESK